MSPWTILAWIVLAALYAAVCVGAWLLGRFLGWPGWPVPAVGIGLIALALLFALIKRVATAPDAPPAVTPGLQPLTPGMAALTPPRELAKRWRDFLPLLGTGSAPVFLAVGEEDALRRRLWLSTPECRLLRDDASGLSFVVYPDSIWLDVPEAFVAAPAGAPGLWEELLRFLPALPGSVRGVLVFAAGREIERARRAVPEASARCLDCRVRNGDVSWRTPPGGKARRLRRRRTRPPWRSPRRVTRIRPRQGKPRRVRLLPRKT